MGTHLNITTATIDVWRSIEAADGWVTHADLGDLLPHLSARTVRDQARRLADADVVDRMWLYPAMRYRYRRDADPAVVGRLTAAAEAVAR